MTRTFWSIGLLHPAFILRGNWKEEPAQVVYLRRAKEIAKGGWEAFDASRPPQGAILHPKIPDDLLHWEKGVGPGGVSVDIECANRLLRCVGLCRLDDGISIVVPLVGQGGKPAYAPEDLSSVRRWLKGFLANQVPKYFHNGLAFDIPILRHNGYTIGNYAGDTMLMHRIAYPEVPKSLKYLANLYLGIGGWKSLVSQDDEGEEK